MAVEGIQQNSNEWRKNLTAPPPKPSFVVGEVQTPLWEITLTQLLQQQVLSNPSGECVIFPEHNYRATYNQLYQTTLEVAQGLRAIGVGHGDRVGIFAGNIPAYVELFFAVSHVGAAYVVFNTTYTPKELQFALQHSGRLPLETVRDIDLETIPIGCKAVFVATSIGKTPTNGILDMLSSSSRKSVLTELKSVILLKDQPGRNFDTYDHLRETGKSLSKEELSSIMASNTAGSICNLQFTSGTTGAPKAAMLTHLNVINNGRFVGDRMRLTSRDIICCPPPLFHCFGLVLGLVAVFTHGGCIVFPSETFQPASVLRAVVEERCTGLHGVPAMFSAELELHKANLKSMDFSSLRTGIAAGSPVPKKMMMELREVFNLTEATITYGMTETSPASFMSFTDDPVQKRLTTVGKILPHTKAKIVDHHGKVVPVGVRGELCVAGFQLQKGYWRNPKQTAEAMQTDDEGCLWMRTGDEAVFDSEGYCSITGRIKDIIIRGGENILPLEIEERLEQHKAIIQSSVVGLPDEKYGEAVCAFIQPRLSEQLPSAEHLRDFVRQTLGWHKAPVHIFWLSEGEGFPRTGSGKIQKHILREQGQQRLRRLARTSKM